MAKTKELNTKIRKLESEIVSLKIDKHKSDYIHIPKPNGLWCAKFLGFIVSVFLSIANFILLKTIWIQYNLGYIFAETEELANYTIEVHHLIVLYPLIGQYILISLSIIAFVSLFKELKSYNEKGLILGLIFGLISGLIFGLIIGLIIGLILGLIIGLISGLIHGLIEEFK